MILGGTVWADTTQTPRPGWGVAVEGDRVVAVASHDDLGARFPRAQSIAARDCVITPAFVNAHHHMYGVAAHGIPLDKAPAGFLSFLERFWWPRVEDRLTHELIAAATDWVCLEMIRSGVMTFYDCLEAPYALPGALAVAADLVRRRGLRAVLSFEATERVNSENGERIVNLERMYNVRQGLSRADDQLPRRFVEEAITLFGFERDPETGELAQSEQPIGHARLCDFDAMLDRYYDLRSWSRDGIPTPETLRRLGLETRI